MKHVFSVITMYTYHSTRESLVCIERGLLLIAWYTVYGTVWWILGPVAYDSKLVVSRLDATESEHECSL